MGQGEAVRCARCADDNRPDARFCVGCGAELTRACRSCGRELPVTARFCDSCGESVDTTDDVAARGDVATRRTVTALFCDLVGSTAFGERVDAESVREAMARYRRMAQEAIEDNGGEVAKFIGDGVMAMWGVHGAAEDDALRAVRAGVALQDGFAEIEAHIGDRHDIEVGLRVGINTGEVVIGDEDDDIVGDALNTAARLEAAAAPGTVLVGDATWRLTRHQVEFADPIEIAAKGKDELVAAHEVVAAAGVAEVLTPFVGRTEELARLRRVLEDTVLERAARMVCVVGSPGVGKTRLAHELRNSVEVGVRSFELRCEPSGDVTFAPVVDLLRAVAELRDDQAPGEIVSALERVLDGSDDAARVADILAGFLGAAPMRSTEEAFFAVRRLLEVLGATDPLVLVVDDIQWAEPLFLDLLEHLAEWVRGAPLLIVALARPEIREVRASFAEQGRRIAAVVSLEGLDRDTTGELAARLLGTEELPPGLLERIPDSTEGNPLFVREVVRMLVDDGVIADVSGRWELVIDLEAVEVPPTVTALLATRVDRMAPDERTILELASVVGSEFPVGALSDIHDLHRPDLEAALERMRRKELVEPTGAYLGNEPVFRFHHVLIREAAYRRLLKGARAELHEAVGEWTERVSASLVGEFEVAIAAHFEQAHGYRRELDHDDEATARLGRRAAALFEVAARRALEQEDLEAAGSLASRALAVLPDAAAEVPELLLVGCEALLSVGRVADAQPLIGRLAAVGADDPRLSAWHTCFDAELAVLTDPGGIATAEERVAAAAQDLAALDDSAGVAKAHWVRALALVRLGKVGECEAELDLALTAARAADDHRRATAVLGAAPMAALWGPSPVPRAGGRCLDVIRLLRITTASPAVEATSLRCQGLLEAMRGRFDTARTMLATARASVEELGLGHAVAQVDLYLGIAELLAGDPARAEPHLRTAHRGLGTLGIGPDAGQAAAYLARALLLQGRLDDAETLIEESEALAGDNQQTAIVVRTVHAEVLAARGRHTEALARADEAVALAAARDILFDHANAVAVLARVRAAAGDAEGAARAAVEACVLYERKGAVPAADLAAIDADAAGPPRSADRESGTDDGAGDATDRGPGDAVSGRELWNRAEQHGVALLRRVLTADRRSDDWAASVAADAIVEDRRENGRGRLEGRDRIRAFAASGLEFTPAPLFDTVAVRGDDLALVRLGSATGDADAIDLVVLLRFDERSHLDLGIVFDAAMLDEAVAELDRLHMETLPTLRRLLFEASVARPRLLGVRRDAAAAFRHLHPTEFRMIDRRAIGFPEMDLTEYLDRIGMFHDLGARMTLVARRVVRNEMKATVVEYRTVLTSPEGDETHQDSLMVTLSGESGLCVRQLQFDLHDEALATRVADDHLRAHRLSPGNLAFWVGGQVHGRVLPLHPNFASAQDRAADEHRLARHLPDTSRLGREPHVFDVLDRRVIAIRGDELALIEARRDDGTVVWSLEEVDTEGQLVAWELFDDAGAAADRLDDRFVELDPMNREPGAEFSRAFRALDPVRMAAAVTDDFIAVDHRALGFGTVGAGELVSIVETLPRDESVTIVQEHVARSGDGAVNQCVVLHPSARTELHFLSVDVFRGERMARTEFFDIEDEKAAWSRYRELIGGDAAARREIEDRRIIAVRGDHLTLVGARREDGTVLWSVEEVDADDRIVDREVFEQDRLREAYTRLSERWAADHEVSGPGSTRYRDLEGFLDAVADDFELVDHRAVGYGTLDRDEFVAAIRLDSEQETVLIEAEVIASENGVGLHRSVLVRPDLSVTDPGRFQIVVFVEGRMTRVELFDLDYGDAAWARFRELSGARPSLMDRAGDDRTAVAVRGENLALYEVEVDGVPAWSIEQVDDDGRVIDQRPYVADDLVAALRELDRRHTRDWPAADRHRFDMHITRRSLPGPYRESGPTENRAALGALAPDFVAVDHRDIGFGEQGADEFVERLASAAHEFGTGFIDIVESVPVFDEHGHAYRARLTATVDGRRIEIPFAQLIVFSPDGQFVERQERFAFDRMDAAVARLAELTAGRAPMIRNLATEVGRWVNACVRRDSPPVEVAEFVADGVDLGSKPHGFGVTARRPLAVRGDRFAVVEFERDGETGWVLEEIDESERLADWQGFDDPVDALVALDERYGQTLPARWGFLLAHSITSRVRPFAHDIEDVERVWQAGSYVPDYVEVDHRELGFGVQDADEVIERLRSARDLFGARANLEVFDTIAVHDWRGVVTRGRLCVETDGGGIHEIPYAAMHLLAPGGQLLERTERFEYDDLELAVARLEELAAGRTPPVENLASAVGRVVNACVRVDSPLLASLLGEGVDLSSKPHGFGLTERRPVAVRGEELALYEVAVDGERAWSLEEVGLDGKLVGWERFPGDGLMEALDRLDERHRDLHPERRDHGAPLFRALRALDPAAFAKSVTDDFSVVDHRRLGFGSVSRDRFVEALREGLMDVPFVAEQLANTETAALSRGISAYPEDGMESPYFTVAMFPDGRPARVELFDIEDEAAAWARFRELGREGATASDGGRTEWLPRSNRATEAWRLLSEAWDRGDVEEAMRHIRDDMTFEVKRRGVQGVSGGLDTLIENSTSWGEVGLRPSLEVIGILSDRHAVSAVTFATDDEAQSVELVSAVACDEQGRISSVEIYDDVDLRDAIIDTAHRVLAEVDHLPLVVQAWYAFAGARPGFPERWAPFVDEMIVVDHRPGSLMTLSGAEFREVQINTPIQSPGIATLNEFIEADGRVGICRTRRWADPGRGGAEWDVFAVVVAEPGRIERLEVFDPDQQRESWARYLELTASESAGSRSDRPANIAVTNQIVHARLSREKKWADLRAGFHPDFDMVSHRRLGVDGVNDAAALVEEIRSFVDIGFVPLDPVPVRTAGERHALLRNRQTTPDGQEIEMLRVVEVAADGRCLRSANFEIEDQAAAEALLEQWTGDGSLVGRFRGVELRDLGGGGAHRWVVIEVDDTRTTFADRELRAAAARYHERAFARVDPPTRTLGPGHAYLTASNARDVAALADVLHDEFETVDHRQLGFGSLGKADFLALVAGAADVDAVSVITGELVVTEHASLTRGTQFSRSGDGWVASDGLVAFHVRDGRLIRYEIDDVDDEADARARFAERVAEWSG